MIETPLDILDIRRETFAKSLFDGVGFSEAASEYLEAHHLVTKADLYYQPPVFESWLLDIAKAEGETNYFTLGPESGAMGNPNVFEEDMYQGQLQYLPEFAGTMDIQGPVQENPHLQHMFEEVEHTFHNGETKMIPKYIAHNFNYYAPSNAYGGLSPADYNNRRLQNKYNWGVENPTQKTVFTEGIFDNFPIDRHEPTIKHHEDNSHPNDENVRHMLENRYLDGDVPSLKDVLFGTAHLPAYKRKMLYDRILELGGIDQGAESDRDHNGSYGAQGMPFGRMITNLYKRALPLFRKLISPDEIGADNQHGVLENMPEDYRTAPDAVFKSLRPGELERFHMSVLSGLGIFDDNAGLIDGLTKYAMKLYPQDDEATARRKALLQFSRNYDLPKYSSKDKKFTVEKIGHNNLSRGRWHESVSKENLTYNGLLAGLHYDEDGGELYPYLNKDNPSGLKYDPAYEINPITIKQILAGIEKTNQSMYTGANLRRNSAGLLHPYVHRDEMQSWMNNDPRSLTHFWTQMHHGIAGHGLEPNNAALVMAHIFQHGDGNLLFDMNHPEDEDNFIHPKGPAKKDNDDAKPIGGAHKALGFMGQQQQHIVVRPYFDVQEVLQHKKSFDRGEEGTTNFIPHPNPKGYKRVPVNQSTKSLSYGYYQGMPRFMQMQVDAVNDVRSNNIPSFALSVGTPALTGITRAGQEIKKHPTMFSRNPEADANRFKAHQVNLKAPAGQVDKKHIDILRNRGEFGNTIDGTRIHSNTNIKHVGEIEHHDRNIWSKNKRGMATGVITGERNSPLFPQATHTVDFDDELMSHYGDKLVTDILRRDQVDNTPMKGDVDNRTDILNQVQQFFEENRERLKAHRDEKQSIEWQLDTRQNPQHVRNFEQRAALEQRLTELEPLLAEENKKRSEHKEALRWLNSNPRHDINELFEMINNRIDGASGLEGGRLEAELARYERGRRGGFGYTKGREEQKRAVKQADLEAITNIAEDEREKWIDSQGLSFGDPNNIPLYLGNLSIFIRAMERRLHSEDTGGKYVTLQNHYDHNTDIGRTHKTPITPKGNIDGKGTFNYFGHHGSNGSNIGLVSNIKPVYNSRNELVRFEEVEPYYYVGRTLTRPMYKQVGHEYEAMWGGHMDRGEQYGEEFGIEGGYRKMVRKQEDATLLLASLSNPDIMLKKDGEYPILQPMHRIFKLEDLEHLRGFSGDWIVSAMPEGPRAFVEKKDDKITVRGDFDLDDDTKKNFSKISKKDFVVDVVLAGKEYNVIDIVEYEDSDVHDMPLQERIKILRGTMESTENVLLPAAHNLRLTDDVGLEVIVKDLLKEHRRLVLRDANSTYMKGENRHPKWVLYDEGQDVNLMVLDKKGTSTFTYRLGTGPITHEDSLGERAVEYEGDTYMDVGTSFQTKDNYEVGDIVTVNVDSISVAENIDGADIYTVNSSEIKGEAEGEGVSSVETLSMFTKSEPMMWPHEIDRDGDRIVIKMAAGDVSYRASEIDGEWYMFNPKADNTWLIRLSESQRPFWSSVAGVMLKADLSLYDEESKAEVHESKNDAKPLIPPKKVKNTSFWDTDIDEAIEHKKKVKRLLAKSLALASSMLKSSVGAVGDASSGPKGLGIDFATPIESPSGPTSLVGSKTLPDYDVRDIERDNKERAEDKKMGYREAVPDDEQGELAVNRDKAAFVSY